MMVARILVGVLMATGLSALAGCESGQAVGPYSSMAEGDRNTQLAQQLTREAAEIIQSDPEEAERLLREALTADIFFGPGHNDLGVLHLRHDRLFEAANEFEWARKLMPGHPDPRLNLALTLERAGKVEAALAAYSSALEVYPGHIASMQGLARLQLRSGRADAGTRSLLEEIALRGESETWRDWAQAQLIRLESAVR